MSMLAAGMASLRSAERQRMELRKWPSCSSTVEPMSMPEAEMRGLHFMKRQGKEARSWSSCLFAAEPMSMLLAVAIAKLHYAKRHGKEARKWPSCLVDGGANVDAAARGGITPLHEATWRAGKTEVAKLLIDSGANVDAAGESGWAPLHGAGRLGGPEVAKLLIDSGALVDLPSDDGRAALSIAHEDGKENVKEILRQNGAAIEWMTKKMSQAEIERFRKLSLDTMQAYVAVVNGACRLSSKLIIKAAANRKLASLKEMWMAHNSLLLAKRCGIAIEEEENPDYWHAKLRKDLCKRCAHSKELAASILEDAKESGLIDRAHKLAAGMGIDLQSDWVNALHQLGPMARDVYDRLLHIEHELEREARARGEAEQRAASKMHQIEHGLKLETRARRSVENALMKLHAGMTTLQKDMKSDQRRRKHLNFVRLGLSLIPVAGGCLSGGIETAGEVIAGALSSAKDVGDLILATYDAAEGVMPSHCGIDACSPKTLKAALPTSGIKRLPKETQKLLDDCVESTFGDLDKLRRELDEALRMTDGESVAMISAESQSNASEVSTDMAGQTLSKIEVEAKNDARDEATIDNGVNGREASQKASDGKISNSEKKELFAEALAQDLAAYICEARKGVGAEGIMQLICENAERKRINRKALLSKRAISAEKLTMMLLEGAAPSEAFESMSDGRIIITIEYILCAREELE